MRGRRQTRGIGHIDLTDIEPASSETARRINRDIVLEFIHEHQPISRADLSRVSGLQRSTVSQIVEQLIQEKLVREGAQASAARGRRPTLLGLNEDLLAIAVDIHPGQAMIAAVDLKGRFHSREVIPINKDPGPSTQSIIQSIVRMKRSISSKSIEGIGISLPGRVDPTSERLIFAPNLGWRDFDLKARVEAKLDLPVKMENAATACLLAELTFGNLDGERDVVLVTISEGVGTGIFANGRVIAGNHGMAGEFGHIPIDPSGPRCACGRRGCWEVYAGCPAALRYFREDVSKSPKLTFSELLMMADRGDSHALKAVVRQAKYIAMGLLPIITGLAPSLILIAGEITSAWSHYGPVIEKTVSGYMLDGRGPRILPAQQGETARLRGAASLIFRGSSPGIRS